MILFLNQYGTLFAFILPRNKCFWRTWRKFGCWQRVNFIKFSYGSFSRPHLLMLPSFEECNGGGWGGRWRLREKKMFLKKKKFFLIRRREKFFCLFFFPKRKTEKLNHQKIIIKINYMNLDWLFLIDFSYYQLIWKVK